MTFKRFLLFFFISLLLLPLLGYLLLKSQLDQAGIDILKLELDAIDRQGFQIKQLDIRYTDGATAHQMRLEESRFNWRWWGQAAVPQVNIGKLSWHVAAPASEPPAKQVLTLPKHWRLPDWLPEDIQIRDFSVTLAQLPTQEFKGGLHLTRRGTHQYQLEMRVQPSEQDLPPLELSAHYQGLEHEVALELKAHWANFLRLVTQVSLASSPAQKGQGTIAVRLAQPNATQMRYLRQWGIDWPEQTVDLSSDLELLANWQVTLPQSTALSWARLKQADSEIELALALPEPLPVPKLGRLSGRTEVQWLSHDGQIAQYQALANLSLEAPQLPPEIEETGLRVHSVKLHLEAQADSPPDWQALPAKLKLQLMGDAALRLEADLAIGIDETLRLTTQGAKLQAQVPQFDRPDIQVRQLQLDTLADLMWDEQQMALTLRDLQLKGAVDSFAIKTTNLSMTSAALDLKGPWQNPLQLDIGGTISGTIEGLEHSELKRSNWQWHAQLAGTPSALKLAGQLNASQGLALSYDMGYQPEQTQLDWQLGEVFFLAGNPLRKTLRNWPPLLEVQRGKLLASGQIQYLASQQQITSTSRVELQSLSGVYDRTMLKGLSTDIEIKSTGSEFNLRAAGQINALEQGFLLGPGQFSLSYQADLSQALLGVLNIERLESSFLGGSLKIQPQQLLLSAAEQLVPIEVNNIDLAKLLEQHPSTELFGSGLLAGTIPLRISAQGLSVAQGHLFAQAPGGRLQYQPKNAQAVAASNPAMKLLVDALGDFHYSLLSSEVSYQEQGDLLLSLKLEGQNPGFEQGRAIHLNINLEEDLPALLTSLQLNSQISDKVKQRIQQRILNQQEKSSPTRSTE